MSQLRHTHADGGARFDAPRSLFRNRYADEWVGLLVLLALAAFVAAIVEAGVLRHWLAPEKRIHFVLPQAGVNGLAVGGDIEVMGVHAGEIKRLDLNSEGRMYAEGAIEPQFAPFIRQDSTALIAQRLVVAGASYISLTRGTGKPLDWHYAVLDATASANPADMITSMVNDLRAQLLPAVQNIRLLTEQMNAMLTDVRAGKGTIGGLVERDETLRRVDQALESLNAVIAKLEPLEKQAGGALVKADGALGNARDATAALRSAMPDAKAAVSHVNEATAELPGLITQAEASAASLRRLADQLRGMWLLGGGGKPAPDRLSAHEVRP